MPGYVCPPCGITVEASCPDEAELLADAHDRVMHNDRQTALVAVAA